MHLHAHSHRIAPRARHRILLCPPPTHARSAPRPWWQPLWALPSLEQASNTTINATGQEAQGGHDREGHILPRQFPALLTTLPQPCPVHPPLCRRAGGRGGRTVWQHRAAGGAVQRKPVPHALCQVQAHGQGAQVGAVCRIRFIVLYHLRLLLAHALCKA